MTFNNKTIEELHNLLVSKEISATELTQVTLDDIKAGVVFFIAFQTGGIALVKAGHGVQQNRAVFGRLRHRALVPPARRAHC